MPYTINGENVSLDSEPQLKDGTLWVPFRAVGEALGAKVDYDADNKVAILYHGDHMATVKIGDPNVDVDGTNHTLQAAPYAEDGDTWIPVRFFNSALGAGLNVDLSNNSVELTAPETV